MRDCCRVLRALILIIASCTAVIRTANASIVVTTIGDPVFLATDFHVFSAPYGTAASAYAEAVTTLETILPPPNHVFNPVLTIGPGAPHPGPYTTEMGQGVAAAGYRQATQFT